jgi:hypothetical protein
MNYSGTGNDKVPLSTAYVAEGTYPADICVLRYALERNARVKPNDVFAAFEGGECWTFAQTMAQGSNSKRDQPGARSIRHHVLEFSRLTQHKTRATSPRKLIGHPRKASRHAMAVILPNKQSSAVRKTSSGFEAPERLRHATWPSGRTSTAPSASTP